MSALGGQGRKASANMTKRLAPIGDIGRGMRTASPVGMESAGLGKVSVALWAKQVGK